jgi:predicted dithiol-disulfide oxidoreductase (DUF899 family)
LHDASHQGEPNGRQHHPHPRSRTAAKNKAFFPNESREYRQARNALLAEEIELRRHIERVAALRRTLPPAVESPKTMPLKAMPVRSASARNLHERVALAVTARSPIERLLDYKKERGWQSLPIYSDMKGDYTSAYVSAEDGDVPGITIFTRGDGTVRHFWSGEMADPSQDPRGAPDLDPLWTILDLTPAGRGTTWYPKLEYANLATIK